MASSRIKMTALIFSTQATVLVPLPDLPNQVVQVSSVIWQLGTFTAATGVVVVMHHNVSLAVTLSVNDFGSAWCRLEHAASNGGPAPAVVEYNPPYELVGPQRCDHVSSAGTVIGSLLIIYTMRAEPSDVLWNALRRRTSFEKG